MSKGIIKRIYSKQAITILLLACVLRALTLTNSTSFIDLLGGIPIYNNGSLNLLEIIKWNICVLPPVSICALFTIDEFGSICRYTMLRDKSIQHWYKNRLYAVILANYSYCLAFIFITCILRISSECNVNMILLTGLLFPLHTTLLSVVFLFIYARYKTPKLMIIVYLIVNGIMTIIGSIFPSTCKFLLPFWGMAVNQIWLFSNQIIHLLLTISISLLLIISINHLTMRQLRNSNPAAILTMI